jgi:tetratricopeptide (TPR) repeat protein
LIASAMGHFERARALLESTEAAGHRARLMAEQADVMATLGLTGEAAETLRAAIPELDQSLQVVEAASARVAYARSLIALGQFREANDAVNAAVATFTELDRPIDLGRAYLTGAGLALHQEDHALAGRLASQAAAALADRPSDAAKAAVVAARVALASGALKDAEDWISRALSLAARYELDPVETDAFLLLGRLRRRRGEPALEALLTAVESAERIRGTLQAGIFRSSFKTDRIAPYVELLTEAIQVAGADGIAIAFRASELIKSRGLLDLIDQVAPLGDGTGSELETEVAKLREALNWHYSRIAITESTADGGEIRKLEQELNRLETRLAATAPPGQPGLPPVDLQGALDGLRAGTAVISYAFAGDELIAFVLRDGSCAIHRGLSDLASIEVLSRRLHLQLSRGLAGRGERSAQPKGLADAKRELQALWSALMAPVETEIAGSEHLVIVPAGPLHMVPFAALWNGETHVIERMTVNTVPSVSILTRLNATEAVKRLHRQLVVGVADAQAPGIAEEVTQIASTMAECTLLTGREASTERVRAIAASTDTVHFACHGRFSRSFPNASGLKLADRWLTLAEIVHLPLRDTHVTLSGCDTGTSMAQDVEERIGLASGLYAAGARSIIASLWPVDDAATRELMTDLYRFRRKGANFVESLRQAQIAALSAGAHPVAWAPFTFGGKA